LPEHVVGRDGDDLLLKNYKGSIYRYPDPTGEVTDRDGFFLDAHQEAS
jgi:lysine 2,3-aminomutase